MNGLCCLAVMVGLSVSCVAQQSVALHPGANIQAQVNSHPAATTFTLTAGVYRLQSIVPKTKDTFIGQPGAIISGAALVTNFSRNGSFWQAHVPVKGAASYPGKCTLDSPACTLPEDLFVDNVPFKRVANRYDVVVGKWYLDYSTGTVFIKDDPTFHKVEISLLPVAFTGTGQSVTISQLVIEKYACVGGAGAINGGAGSKYWSVNYNEVRWNHGIGIQSGDGMYIHDNKAHHNGELGIGGKGTSVRVQSNTITFNNYAGYSAYNEAGGAKFTGVQGLTFQYNTVSDNHGPGFWVDINSRNVVCNQNRFTANQIAGILLEISNTVTVSGNYIVSDGFNSDGTGIWWGAGILVSNSSNVTITNNTITNCMNGIAGILAQRGNGSNGQPLLLQNINASGNTITQKTGIAIGIANEGVSTDNAVYTSLGNKLWNNTLVLTNPSGAYIYWLNTPMTVAAWGALKPTMEAK